MLYLKPEMDILKIETTDVIRTSDQVTVNGNHDIDKPLDYSDETDNVW